MLLGSCGVIGATMSNAVLPVVTPPPAVPQLALWPPVAASPPLLFLPPAMPVKSRGRPGGEETGVAGVLGSRRGPCVAVFCLLASGPAGRARTGCLD